MDSVDSFEAVVHLSVVDSLLDDAAVILVEGPNQLNRALGFVVIVTSSIHSLPAARHDHHRAVDRVEPSRGVLEGSEELHSLIGKL